MKSPRCEHQGRKRGKIAKGSASPKPAPRPPRPPLKDAVRDTPKVVISAAELRVQLKAWIAVIDGDVDGREYDPTLPTLRSRCETAADLVYEIQTTVEGWVEELEEEDM